MAACESCGAPVSAGARFCSQYGAPLAAGRATRTEQGERRQLTVLFCDLVGSTALSTQLDPEEWRDVLKGYHHAAAEVIGTHGGLVAQYLGDGVLAFFGYPEAHGDDAERAVRAGLEIVGVAKRLAIGDRRPEPPATTAAANAARLAVRIGIHTGPALVTAGRAPEVFGETPNIAARVQAVARADQVLITAATARLVDGHFRTEALGPSQLKGVTATLDLYRVVSAHELRNRFDAVVGRGLTPFVGRSDERRLLHERWRSAQAGDGQVILLVGEAGIGKSRLLRELRSAIDQPHQWLESAGSPYLQAAPFAIATDLLRQWMSANGKNEGGDPLAALGAVVEGGGMPAGEALPVLAPLLGQETGADWSSRLPSAEQRQRTLQKALTAWIFGISATCPVALIVEDLHWVDPSTLEWLRRLADHCATVKVLLLATARPELQLPWPLRAHHSLISLNRLGRQHTREMIQRVSGGGGAASAPLGDAAVEAVAARTDGVPLFIEELTKAMLERSATGDTSAAVPMTLQDSLMARLDRLGEAKDIALMASVIGRRFSGAVLQVASGLPAEEVETGLQRLTEAGLVLRDGDSPGAPYTFKHRLVQETAYASLPRSRRRALHRQVAGALAAVRHPGADAPPERLAHHYCEAGDLVAAIEAWQRAAAWAVNRGALGEAASHYRRALGLLTSMPESRQRTDTEIGLWVGLAQVSLPLNGWASTEVSEAYERALALSEHLGDETRRHLVLLGLTISRMTRGDLEAARRFAHETLATGERLSFSAGRVWGHFALGAVHLFSGELEPARQHTQAAIRLYRGADFQDSPADPGISGRSYAALTEWHLGRADAARRLSQEAIDLAATVRKPHATAFAYQFAGVLYVFLREPQRVLELADRLGEVATELHFPMYRAMAFLQRGWALARLGHVEEGLPQLRDGLERYVATGQHLGLGWYLALLAEAEAISGHADDALATLTSALADTPQRNIAQPHLLWLRAELVLQADGSAQRIELADVWYRRALASATELCMPLYQLRIATSRVRWRRSKEARQELAAIAASIREGFDTRDWQDAQAALRE